MTPPIATGTSRQPTTRRKRLKPKLTAPALGKKLGTTAAGYLGSSPAAKLGADVGATVGKALANANPAGPAPAATADPYDLSAKLTPENVKALVDAQTRLRYGGQTQALKQQDAALPGYFADYRQRLQQLAQGLIGQPTQTGQLGGAYGAGLTSLARVAGQLGQGAQTAAAESAAEQLADAKLRGATPSATPGQDATGAYNVRSALLDNMAGLLASQGLTEGSYLANRSASSGPLQIQAQAKLDAAIAALKGDKGAYRTQAVADLRDQKAARADARQKAKLEAAAFGLDQQKEKDTVATTITKLKADLRKAAAGRRSSERQNTQDNQTSLTNTQARLQAERERLHAEQAKARRQHRQEQRQTQRDHHKQIKETIARIHAYQQDEVPVDANDPKKGTRAPTPTEIRDRLLHEGFTQRQINQALAKIAKRNTSKSKADGALPPLPPPVHANFS